MTDWRARYLKLADEAEKQQHAQEHAERELTRLMTRVCVAVSGLDPAIDPHLDHLREAARGGNAGRLLQQSGVIADGLAEAAEDRSRPTILSRLLERGSAKHRQVEQALKLWAELSAAPAKASDAKLDKLAELLQEGLGDGADEAAPRGLLARLTGKPAAAPQHNRQLLEVMQQIDWPPSLQPDISELEQALEADAEDRLWVETVRRVSELFIDALGAAEQNARAAEDFLTTLNRHLEELDRHMLGEGERREQSRKSGELLGERMDGEVDDLSRHVRASSDLAELQANVLGSIERMRSHVSEHLREESSRLEQAEAEAESLRADMTRLERDTFDLRRKVAKTHRQALHDPLTGLPNRRAYDERIAQEYARWKRFGDPLALIVWDVDDFKKVNDTYGHKSGDKALVMIGRLLSARLRETDFIARYGGEEIVVLLTGAEPDDVMRLAEDMRKSVEQGGLHAHGKPVRITVSGGAALFSPGDIPEAVFERADKALYRAKQQGKNCIIDTF